MNGEVLSEDEDQTAVDGAAAGHYAVAEELLFLHAEVMATVFLEHVVLFEGAGVEQHVDALAGGVFTFLMLFLNSFLTAAETCLLALGNELLDFF